MVELMPESYALSVGLANIGGAFSILFWSWIPLLLTNPDNLSAKIEMRENNRTAYYFGKAVTSRVPYFFRVAMIMAIVAGS
jgi:hypothetical protein